MSSPMPDVPEEVWKAVSIRAGLDEANQCAEGWHVCVIAGVSFNAGELLDYIDAAEAEVARLREELDEARTLLRELVALIPRYPVTQQTVGAFLARSERV